MFDALTSGSGAEKPKAMSYNIDYSWLLNYDGSHTPTNALSQNEMMFYSPVKGMASMRGGPPAGSWKYGEGGGASEEITDGSKALNRVLAKFSTPQYQATIDAKTSPTKRSGIYLNKTGGLIGIYNFEEDKSVHMINNGARDFLGTLGESIDVTIILANVLDENSKAAMGIYSPLDYAAHVGGMKVWDYKNDADGKSDAADNTTIFGLAWAYDHRNSNSSNKTGFKYNGMKFKNAADVGNYHAGYVGAYLVGGRGYPPQILWLGAGGAETLKDFQNGNIGSALLRSVILTNGGLSTYGLPGIGIPGIGLPPDGDRVIDCFWNTRGWIDGNFNKIP